MTSDGAELAAIEAGDPAGPTIVLLHGYPDTKEIWSGVAGHLASRFHVIGYDLRGFGRSSTPRGPSAYGYERLADDLEAVLESLATDQRFHLVGHDWGGIMGWQFAAMSRFDGRLASFTTVAGPSLEQVGVVLRRRVRDGRVLEVLRLLYRSWYVLGLCVPGWPTFSWRVVLARGRWAWLMRHRERLATDPYFGRATLAADGIHGSNLYRQNILRRLLRPPQPQSVRVPVQLIVASDDHYISTGYYDAAEHYAPDLVRRTIGGSHWVPLANPDRLAAWIAEFVEEVEAR